MHWPLNGILIAVEWLLPAGAAYWTLRTNREGVPIRFKVALTVVFTLLSAAIFCGIAYGLSIMTRQIHLLDYVALLLWFGHIFLWIGLWRFAMAKWRAQSALPTTTPKNSPAFFWQGALILLPVGVMAVIGLFSLRQDRLMAEQDARESGAALAQQLTRLLGGELELQLRNYQNANFELQGNWQAAVALTHWAPGTDLAKIKKEIEDWQQAHPEVDLAKMPKMELGTGLAGESPASIFALEYPLSPRPPRWLNDLSEEQSRLWHQVQSVEYGNTETNVVQSAVDAFLATKPARGAQANAKLILLQAQVRHLPADEASPLLASSRLVYSDELSDAGLPVGQLVCYEALRRTSSHAALPPIPVSTVASAIFRSESLLSPALIAELDRVVGSDSNAAAEISAVHGLWSANEATKQLVADFRDQCPPATWSNGFFWASSQGNEFLLNLAKFDGRETTVHSTSETYVTNVPPSWKLHAFPRAIVSNALIRGVTQADLAIPKYMTTVLEIGGREIDASRGVELAKTNLAGLPILGGAAGLIEVFGNPTNAYKFPFQTRVYLTNPAILYARQRQRSLLFGGLILASALAASIGFWTARRAFYRQLRLNTMKSDFVSSVSHELRAPIASVRLMAEGLERGKIVEPEKQREYFGFIVQECRRLSSLIENVLDFSRIEQGRKQYELESTDLVALTQQTVKLMDTYAAERGVNISLRVEGEASPVELDGKAMQQALVNLIDNALKHSPKGAEIIVGLEFTLQRVSGPGQPEGWTPTVNIWVEDKGEGIAASEHEKIFERFYRVGSELRRETQGVGIGLSIVKHIVEAHGGKVTVRSAPGAGSRFTIELPAGAGSKQ